MGIARITGVVSEVTGKREPATICPEMRSTIDGKLICEGIANIDLLAMHDMGVDRHGRIMPIELLGDVVDYNRVLENGSRPMCEQAKNKMLKSWAKIIRVDQRQIDKETRLKEHEERIRANEHRWNEYPTDEEVEELCEDPEIIEGIAKWMMAYQ